MVRASLGLSPRIRPGKGFTILEMLVATTVLVLLLTLIMSVLNQTTSTIRQSTAQADTFTAARSAFDLVIRHLSQAILNPYWDYDSPTSPTRYLRQSDLHFVVRQNTQGTSSGQEVFFQAPDGFSLSPSYQSAAGLLNACGYRVVYGSDDGFRAGAASAPRWRYRLMQSLQPAESLQVFDNKDVSNPQWIQSAVKTELPVAENIVAMIVWPRLAAGDDPNGASLTSNYQYNSRDNATDKPQPSTANQLPPTVQITLIAISEASAARLDTRSSSAPAEIQSALAGKFTQVSQYQHDLDDVAQKLAAQNISFQIFNLSVVMKESKWSP
ncbi:Verru_Chthon cassette protein C [Terrimicrobium sacchariphilum]|uniref:Verru_Chthon cassette protein C n=1 Tax=Terrimicrobium sacchariphilum TaxID=690879 RepID=A0A146G330_TERSA|nr:hypothetical protein [Terrimicrobium sacchariphilum]GAT31484.1 Verru_Chthon cassette protein C [Terrimicrobium sacchariphilum]